jgi:hypothetical protein
VFIVTPILAFPQGEGTKPFPPALLRRSGYAKAKGEIRKGLKAFIKLNKIVTLILKYNIVVRYSK